MSYRLEVNASADVDVDDAVEYIEKNNVDAAARFLDAVGETFKEICRPKRWPAYRLTDPRLSEIRKRAVIGFRNYLVFYRVEKQVVEILRVLHGARDIPPTLMELE